MKACVIVFPGSNCDRDMQVALRNAMGSEPEMVWHGDSSFDDVDLMPRTGTPFSARRMISRITGDLAAIAPERR